MIMFTGAIWANLVCSQLTMSTWHPPLHLLFFFISVLPATDRGERLNSWHCLSSYRRKDVSSNLFPIRLSSEPSTEMPGHKFDIKMSKIYVCLVVTKIYVCLVVTLNCARVTLYEYMIGGWLLCPSHTIHKNMIKLCLSRTAVEPFSSQPSP